MRLPHNKAYLMDVAYLRTVHIHGSLNSLSLNVVLECYIAAILQHKVNGKCV